MKFSLETVESKPTCMCRYEVGCMYIPLITGLRSWAFGERMQLGVHAVSEKVCVGHLVSLKCARYRFNIQGLSSS